MKNIYLQILDLINSESSLVLATVTGTLGSTPQKPGCSALFGIEGLISGTVGGGIVEGKVQKLAAEAILSKKSGLYHFDLANDISKTEEAICGGKITVLADAEILKSVSVLEQLKASLATGNPGVLITLVTGFAETQLTIERYWINENAIPSIKGMIFATIEPEVRKLVADKNPSAFSELEIKATLEEPPVMIFLQPFFPPDQLIIAGAGHIGRALAHLGKLLDFEVTVIDDRSEFANKVNIPDADHIIVEDIGKAVNEVEKGNNTYVVIVTRGHKDDASALKPCIGRGLAYIGMIGSKNKISAMKKKFVENGWTTYPQWDQIHAPVGLQIKSQTVEEIAVSIAAELVLVRNREDKR